MKNYSGESASRFGGPGADRPHKPISWTERPRYPTLAVSVGALALLALGGILGMFLGGDRMSAGATTPTQTESPNDAAAPTEVAQVIPSRKVKTTTIVPEPAPAPVVPEPQVADGATPTAPASDAPAADSLPKEDPRWARTTPLPAAPTSASELAEALRDAKPESETLKALAPAMDDADLMTTAAVSRNAERALDQEFPLSLEEEATEEPSEPAAATRTARITRGVNLRARAVSGSAVLTVIPTGASVELVGCKSWCEVIYKGSRGYVWQSFVEGQARSASRPRARATAPAKVRAKAKPRAAAKPKVAAAEPAQARARPAPPFVPKPIIEPDPYEAPRSR